MFLSVAHTFRLTLPDHALGAKMMSSAKSPIVSGLLLPERRWLSAPKRRCNIAVFVLYLRNCFLLFQSRFPLGGFEADEDEVVGDKERALDEHPVCGKELELLILAHVGELFLEVH